MADEKSQSDDSLAGGEAIPEVEAEIVESDDAPPREDAFDDAQDSAGVDADDAHDDAENAEHKPLSKRRTLTPGLLIFIIFAVFALAVFAFWRLQSGSAQQTEDAAADQRRLAQAARPEPRAVAAPVGNELAAAPAFAVEPADDEADALDAPSGDPEFSFVEADAPTGEEPAATTSEAAAIPVETPSDASGADMFAQDDASDAGSPDAEETIDSNEAPSEPIVDEDPDVFVVDETPAVGEDVAEETALDVAVMRAQTESPPAGEEDAAPPPANSAGLDAAKLENDVVALKDELRTETERLSAALDAERRKNAALEVELSDLRDGFADALAARDERTAREFAALRDRFEALERGRAPAPLEPGAAEAAAAALAAALEAGGSYEVELEGLEKVAPETPAMGETLEVLRRYAANGLEPKLALKERFGEAARLALAAAAQEDAHDMRGRLAARAKSLISVRPAEPRPGDSPGAVISRAENAVERDAFALALAELEDLPPPARAAMEDWTAAVRAREDALAAFDAIHALTLSRLPG